jgi:pimeloyl-ACP methyl ester carboxylesterase
VPRPRRPPHLHAVPLRLPALDPAAARHPALQADSCAALLDSLRIDDVAVIAASAGATSALQLAIRHAERVRALILVSPNVPGPHLETSRMIAAVARLLWRFNLVLWVAERYAPRVALNLMGVPKVCR